MPNDLTVIAPLRPESHHALLIVLRRIGDDVRGKTLAADEPFIDFSQTTTHFARFAVLPDPDAGADRFRLLFAAIYDGQREDYLNELVAATRGMDAIWGACEDYRGEPRFSEFVAMHSLESGAFYLAFRDQTLEDVHRLPSSSIQLAEGLNPAELPPMRESQVENRVLAFFQSAFSFLLAAPATAMDMLGVIRRHGLGDSFGAALEIAASLNRIRSLRLINKVTGNRMAELTTNYSEVSLDGCNECRPSSLRDEVVDGREQRRLQGNREDRVAQNQLTLVTVNSPARLRRQKAVLAMIGLYSRRVSKPGLLAGISTIHFVRWTVIDNGKRMIMISDYDGSWEAYIEEFAEMILSGLDAIWGGAEGFPENGARDLQAFKRFLRCRQYQADIFYSGYPRETVLNLLHYRNRTGRNRTGRNQTARNRTEASAPEKGTVSHGH